MLYVKLENAIEKEESKFKILNNIFYKLKYKFVNLKEENIESGQLLVLPNLEKYTYDKLSRYLTVKGITNICISEELMKNKNFIEFLEGKNIKILDGKWLFKHMSFDIVKYICDFKKEKISFQEVSILSNNIDRILKQIIFELAKEVKVLNLITQNENKFKKIENELYEEYGIILNINNNFQKSLNKSDIILNFDFEESELNKYKINTKASVINFDYEISLKEKDFKGINISFLEIFIPMKYVQRSCYLKEFHPTILYESFIYKKTSPENIENEIKKDGVNISFLNNKNGRIRKNEYLKLSKKMAN